MPSNEKHIKVMLDCYFLFPWKQTYYKIEIKDGKAWYGGKSVDLHIRSDGKCDITEQIEWLLREVTHSV